MALGTVTIIGTGMIGGSIGLSARKSQIANRVIGYDPLPEALENALKLGICDQAEPDFSRAVAIADLIVCCAPVQFISQRILEASRFAKPGAILTDVGSTKVEICSTLAEKLPKGLVFVPGHPIAGSEKNGPGAARDNLFLNRLAILTPLEGTPRQAISLVSDFWVGLGARVTTLEAAEHDRIFALTSHLPHLIAYALAALLEPKLALFTGGGFRDTTRVAGSDPELWTEIFRSNRGPLLEALRPFLNRVSELEQALVSDNRGMLLGLLTEAQKARRLIP